MSELNSTVVPEVRELNEAERRLEEFKRTLGKELMGFIPTVNFKNQPLLEEDIARISNVLVPVLVDRIVEAISKLPEDKQVELYEGKQGIWQLAGNEMVYKLIDKEGKKGAEWSSYGDQKFEIKIESLYSPEFLQKLSNGLGVIKEVRLAQLLLERSLKQNDDGSGSMDGSFGKADALLNFIGNLINLDDDQKNELLNLVCADKNNDDAKKVCNKLGIDWAKIKGNKLELVLKDDLKLPPGIVGVVQAVWRLANPNSSQVSPFLNDSRFGDTTTEGVFYKSPEIREATVGGFDKMTVLLQGQAAKGSVELPPLTYAEAMKYLRGVQAQQDATNKRLQQVLGEGGGKDEEIAELNRSLAEERRLKKEAGQEAFDDMSGLRRELITAQQALVDAEGKASDAERRKSEAEARAKQLEQQLQAAEAKIQAALVALGGFKAPGVMSKGNGAEVVGAAKKALNGDK